MSETLQLPDYVMPVIGHATGQLGGGTELEFASQGSRSTVVMIHDADPAYLLKIPKYSPDVTYWESVAEATILDHANRDRKNSPLALPQVLEVSSATENGIWPYMALTYLPGHTYETSGEFAERTTPAERERVGQLVGEFSLWFASTISVETFMKEIAPLFPEQPYPWRGKWDEWFAILGDFKDANFPSLSQAAAEMNEQRLQLFPYGFTHNANQVVHGDMHWQNLIFDGPRATGIVDFGVTWPNRLAEVARPLIAMGPETVDGWNAVMAAHGHEVVTPEYAAYWQKAGDLAFLLNAITGHPFAKDYMNIFHDAPVEDFPDMDWSELAVLRPEPESEPKSVAK